MHRTSERTAKPLALAVAALGVVLFSALPSRADHSLGRPCLSCHALRSTKVVPGSRNILSDNVQDALYQTDFYCGSSWTGGEPLDCSYCHGSTGDIANEIAAAAGGANGSAHPVDVGGDNASYTSAKRIFCNDCHNGDTDNATNPGPDLLPETLCTKGPGDGYPNHHSLVIGATDPGANNLADNPPRLGGKYGPLGGATSSNGGVDWSKTTFATADVLCFLCHDGDAGTSPPYATGMDEDTGDGTGAANILAEFNAGGHNNRGKGNLTHELPCYDCHDPHAASGASGNDALLINGADTPASPYGTTEFVVTGYDAADATGASQRAVCLACHSSGGARVKDESSDTWVSAPPALSGFTPEFPFHAGVHDAVQSSGGCWGALGCHPSPHNTGGTLYCLSCHTKDGPGFVQNRHVDSEFGHVGAVRGNDLLSFHTINYDTSADMSVPDNNGCLKCHDTRGGPANAILKDDDGNFYTGSLGNSFSQREDLKHYDPFCLSCHDGAGNDVEFTTSASYTLSDWLNGGSQTVPAATRLPPQVNNRTGASWDQGYFFTVGHGRGNGQATTAFPWSGNPAPKIPCLECHLYHGSTAFKLLPGPKQTADGMGHVVKGYAYAVETIGTKFTIGGVADSTEIDYTDYTDPAKNPRLGNITPQRNYFRSWYVSEYVNAKPWSTYHYTGSIDTPDGITTHFGTSGEVHDNSDVTDELGCGKDAQTTTTKVGFCNACHFYSQTTDGTQDTYGWVYTHEGSVGLTDCSGNDLKSQMNFFKDCAECHDPHGSGEGQDSAASPANIYMIRKKIKHAPTDSEADVKNTNWWSAVVFTSTTGTDSFDEPDTDNTDDLCTVCHQSSSENANDNVNHNYRSQTLASDHQVGNNCTQCHPHGGKKGQGTTNQGLIGFPQAACNGCHGFPPAPAARALEGGDPNLVAENYPGGGGAHIEHVNNLLLVKFPSSDNAKELCGPCHGDDAGSGPDHATSGELSGSWNIASRAHVNLKERTNSSWDGMAGDPAAGAYGGTALPTTPPGDAVDPADSTCTGVDCHGNPTASESLHWNLASAGDGAGDSDGLGRSQACAGCHDGLDSQAEIRLWDRNDAATYTSKLAPDATRAYYATPSGYSRGGHGDAGIQTEDPFIDSAPGVTTPIDCTACHDAAQPHFPAQAANLHRLRTQTLQAADDVSGLCTRCHTAYNDTAPNGNPLHHPSGVSFTRAYNEPTGVNYDVPAGGEGDVDEFVMYWSDTSYTAIGNPTQVDLPRLDDIFPGQPQNLACTTCHQPHGTDLAVDVGQGGGGTYTEIPDNNMLRLRDTDNTLCNACH
ncbi:MULTISPECIES: hypothetical protein [Deferrisoma]